MHARRQVLVLAVLVALAAMPLAFGEDAPQSEGEAKPPSLVYPASRSSSTWVEKPDGSRVAVGEGVAWQGVKVHLSLLWDLVGVDVKSGKVLYAVNVGAFWNEIGFEQVTVAGREVWAVELRPGPRARTGKDKRQLHDLRTGAKLAVGKPKPPAGKPLKLRAVWKGDHSRVAKAFHLVVSSAGAWDTVNATMFGPLGGKRFGAMDFKTEVLIVTSLGNSWNCDGIGVLSVHEDDARILVRTSRDTYQTMDGAKKTRPYGVFVLPRRPGKTYVLEHDRQGLIGGPALWTETWRGRLGKPGDEIRGLPKGSDVPHKGWER